MKVRNKGTRAIYSSNTFNIYGVSEIIVYSDDGADSDFISNYDIQLSNGTWKDFQQALGDHDIITDNYNTRFFYPKTKEDRERGYTLD